MHMSEGKCIEPSCNVVRPKKTPEELFKFGSVKVNKPKPDLITSKDLCAWEQCSKMAGYRALRRSNSKYCSDACRKSKARSNYKIKNKTK